MAKGKLSLAAKAEILATVLTAVEDTPKVWNRLPKRIQRMIHRSHHDCGTHMEDLTKKDLKRIKEWFVPYD